MTDFRAQAACKDKPPAWWFPTFHGRWDVYRSAREVCDGCEVKDACLADCMATEASSGSFRYGMFGGLEPRQRHALAARRRSA